jgi:8-oxo-dGTP diphosphatase
LAAARAPRAKDLGLREERAEVRAAGGVVWRRRDGELEVLLVYRNRYMDWTFPKGKIKAGETDEDAAVREVEEETGLLCVLGEELPSTEYIDPKLRPKRVRYWAMQATGEGAAQNEVDEIRWLPVAEAGDALSHDRDREVLRALKARRR